MNVLGRRRATLGLFAAVVLTWSGAVTATPKAAHIAAIAYDSVVAISTGGDGIHCTGFVIHATKGYIYTAAHCLPRFLGVYADGRYARIMKADVDLDVAILQVVLPKIALHPRTDPLGPGLAAVIIGHGWGMPSPYYVTGTTVAYVFNHRLGQPVVLLNGAAAHGMSGGPILDEDGHVIGMAQMASANGTLTRHLDALVAYAAGFWEAANPSPRLPRQ